MLLASFVVQGTMGTELKAQQESTSSDKHSTMLTSTDVNNLQNRDVILLSDLLSILEEHFDVTFLYKDEIMADKYVARDEITIGEETGRELSRILYQLGITFQRIDEQTYVLLQKAPRFKMAVTDEQISGTVTDATSGETLPGVNILVMGTSTGTSTDTEGYFELTVPSLQDTLVMSFIGYQTREVPINGRTELNIQLIQETVTGDEVVVVGYGTQRKENLTGSVKQVGGSELDVQPSPLASATLMGKAAGVTVIQNSGQPGRNPGNIRIRGIGTLGGGSKNDPLVLIDGVVGSLDDIPSNDIENISILKDAASAAIYGSRAANGVILVTTKRGRGTDFQISYNSMYGWNKPTRQPEYVNAGTFMRLENEAATNLGQDPIWSEDYIREWEENYQTDPNNYPNTDWVKEVFTGSGFQQKQAFTLSGGTESVNLLGSLAFDEERGTIPNHGFKRYSVRLNTDVKVSEKFNFDVDLNTIRKDRRRSSLSHDLITRQAYRIPPIYAGRWEDGGYGPGWDGRNPIAFAEAGGTRDDEEILLKGKIMAQYEPVTGLGFSLMYAPDYHSSFFKRMRKTIDFFDPETGEELQLAQSTQVSDLLQGWARNFTHNLNFRTDYQYDLRNHSFEILGGYELIEYQRDVFDAYRDEFTLQDYQELDAGSSANQQNSGNSTSYNLQSFFGRFTYDYRSKYLFEANLRYDGSSRFSEEVRWGLFPSFSAGWNIVQEPFMQSQDLFSTLKLRGSWGMLGNQNIAGNFPYAAFINLEQEFIFGGSPAPGAAQLSLANENLTWEETTTFNIGADVTILNDRINLAFDWFKKTTDEILLTLPVPSIIGMNPPYQNAGVVENTGWEIEAGYNGNIGSDFTYGVSVNLSDVKNEVIDLKETGPYINGTFITEEGHPINSIYGYESDGLFDSQDEIDNHATQTGQIAPGDIKYVDQLTVDTNGDGIPDEADGIINADDRIIIGDPFPRYTYGININAAYKNFSVSALFQGIGKRDVLLQQNVTWAFFNAGKITEWQASDYWTPDNSDASYPRLTQTTNHNNFQASDYWMYDASYVRLRNLQVSYRLSNRLTNDLGVRNIRVFFTGQNLVTLFDDLPPGIDPNVPSSTTGNYYPVNRVLSGGIEINF
jgi:TonB-linked SusC/RagA family outer membrane protein